MRKTALSIALAGALALPLSASAQVAAHAAATASIHLDLPTILPPVVVVQPGVRVIPEIEQEVFLVQGAYWTRHDGGWYRAPNPRSGWVLAPGHVVPAALVKIPPGHYKNWKPAKAQGKPKKFKSAGYGDGGDGGRGGHGKKHGKH
jgi:hypothetical protein